MKKLVWIIILLIIIVVGVVVFMNSTGEDQIPSINVEAPTNQELTAQGYSNLQSDDDVFGAIDEAAQVLE